MFVHVCGERGERRYSISLLPFCLGLVNCAEWHYISLIWHVFSPTLSFLFLFFLFSLSHRLLTSLHSKILHPSSLSLLNHHHFPHLSVFSCLTLLKPICCFLTPFSLASSLLPPFIRNEGVGGVALACPCGSAGGGAPHQRTRWPLTLNTNSPLPLLSFFNPSTETCSRPDLYDPSCCPASALPPLWATSGLHLQHLRLSLPVVTVGCGVGGCKHSLLTAFPSCINHAWKAPHKRGCRLCSCQGT